MTSSRWDNEMQFAHALIKIELRARSSKGLLTVERALDAFRFDITWSIWKRKKPSEETENEGERERGTKKNIKKRTRSLFRVVLPYYCVFALSWSTCLLFALFCVFLLLLLLLFFFFFYSISSVVFNSFLSSSSSSSSSSSLWKRCHIVCARSFRNINQPSLRTIRNIIRFLRTIVVGVQLNSRCQCSCARHNWKTHTLN